MPYKAFEKVFRASGRDGEPYSVKIILDSNLGNVFARMLMPLIDPGGLVEIVRAIEMGWHALDDDVIVPKAWEGGFTHMVTCDKRMSSIVGVWAMRSSGTRTPPAATSPCYGMLLGGGSGRRTAWDDPTPKGTR